MQKVRKYLPFSLAGAASLFLGPTPAFCAFNENGVDLSGAKGFVALVVGVVAFAAAVRIVILFMHAWAAHQHGDPTLMWQKLGRGVLGCFLVYSAVTIVANWTGITVSMTLPQ